MPEPCEAGRHPHESGTCPRNNEEQERDFGPAHAGLRGLFVDLLALSFESPVAYAVLLMGAGVALLGYYLIEQDEPDRANGVYTPSDAPTPESVGELEL